MTTFLIVLLVLTVALLGAWRVLGLGAWAEARAAGLAVSVGEAVGMRLRGIPPAAVLRPAIVAQKMEIPVERRLLEAHHLAGGDPMRVLTGVVAARKAGLELRFETLAAVELAGGDPAKEIAALLRERGSS